MRCKHAVGVVGATLTPPTEGTVYATRVAEALKAAAPSVIHVDLNGE